MARSLFWAGIGIAGVLFSTVPEVQGNRGVEPDLSAIDWVDDVAFAPISGGKRTELTLNRKLQRDAARFLAKAAPITGAAIALDAKTGDVLAWVERGQTSGRSVLVDASPPAASVFKIVTTVALYEKTPVTPGSSVCIQGGLRRIERAHLEPPKSGRSVCSPFAHALGHSRNAVYAQLATQSLMRQDLVDVAGRLGFNRNVPFDVAGRLGKLDVPYNDLEFARTAAGFSGSTLSPLGGAFLAYSIAKGGNAPPMKIVKGPAAPATSAGRVMKRSSARRLTRMMEVTVHSGTALDAFRDEHDNDYLPRIRIAGKTGTLRPSKGAPTTTWFVGFAPSRRPEIVLSVMLQNGKVWRRKAKGVARDVFRAYFAGRRRGVTHPLE